MAFVDSVLKILTDRRVWRLAIYLGVIGIGLLIIRLTGLLALH